MASTPSEAVRVTEQPAALAVACPACGARPGRLCIRMSHKTNAHFARWRVIWAQAKQ